MNYNATSSWKSQTYPGTTPCSRKRAFVFVLSLSQSLCFTFSPLTVCPVLMLGSWPLLTISSVPVSPPPPLATVPGPPGSAASTACYYHKHLVTNAIQFDLMTRRQPSPFTEATEPTVHSAISALLSFSISLPIYSVTNNASFYCSTTNLDRTLPTYCLAE